MQHVQAVGTPHAAGSSLNAIVDGIEAALVVDVEGIIVMQAINGFCTVRNSNLSRWQGAVVDY